MNMHQIAYYQKYIDWDIEDAIERFGHDFVWSEIVAELNMEPEELEEEIIDINDTWRSK